MNKLLKRIEKLETLTARLEQTVGEIRNSCSCVGFPEPEDDGRFNCEPGCERCGQLYCICEPEEEEPEDIDIDQEPIEEEEPEDHD